MKYSKNFDHLVMLIRNVIMPALAHLRFKDNNKFPLTPEENDYVKKFLSYNINTLFDVSPIPEFKPIDRFNLENMSATTSNSNLIFFSIKPLTGYVSTIHNAGKNFFLRLADILIKDEILNKQISITYPLITHTCSDHTIGFKISYHEEEDVISIFYSNNSFIFEKKEKNSCNGMLNASNNSIEGCWKFTRKEICLLWF